MINRLSLGTVIMKVSGEINHYTKYILFSDGPNEAYTYISVDQSGMPIDSISHKPVPEGRLGAAEVADCQNRGPCTSPAILTISAGGKIFDASLTLGFVPTVSYYTSNI